MSMESVPGLSSVENGGHTINGYKGQTAVHNGGASYDLLGEGFLAFADMDNLES